MSDALGRLVRVDEPDKGTGALDSGGSAVQSTSYIYDALGNLRKVDQGGQYRYFMYDSLSRLIRVKNPEQGAMAADADFPALTDDSTGPNGNSLWSMGYKYDACGNLLKRKDARGVVTVYGYDGLNRTTTVHYDDAVLGVGNHIPDITRTYDGATRGKGRLWKSESVGTGQMTVEVYDAAGRPLQQGQKFWLAGAWGTAYNVGYTYDLIGNLKTQNYPSGHSVSYTYDGAGRLNSFTGNLGGGGAALTYADTFSYDASGRTQQERYGTTAPVYNKHLFNSRGQLAEVRVSTHALSEQGYETDWNRGALINHYSNSGWGATGGGPDNNGNLKKQDVYIPNDDAITGYTLTTSFYSYDYLNRLRQTWEVRDSSTQWLQRYDYDRWGNRTINAQETQVFVANPTYSIPEPQFTVEPGTNRLNAPAGQSGQMGYDAAGNLTLDTYQGGLNVGGGTRTYDAENRMTSADFFAGQAQTALYVYDADGRRVKRMVGSSAETWQVYGAGGEMLAEYAPGVAPTQPQKEYGYRRGELLVTATSGADVRWLITDQLGTPRMVVDQTGSLSGMTRHDYLPFGEELLASTDGRTTAQGDGVADNVRQKFTSKERDFETGLDYFGARYNSSVQGRFTGTDPVFISQKHTINPQRWNLYSYANNNPLSLTDPDGQDPQGKGGSKTIDIYLTISSKELTKSTWKKIQSTEINGYEVNIIPQDKANGERFKNSLKNSDAVIIFGHIGGLCAPDGKGFTGVVYDIGTSKKNGAMWLTKDGLAPQLQFPGIEYPPSKPETNAHAVALFSCNSSDLAAAFDLKGSEQGVVANTGGKDGVTGQPTMERALAAFLQTYEKTDGDIDKAVAAAQAVITASKTESLVPECNKKASNAGDKLTVRQNE